MSHLANPLATPAQLHRRNQFSALPSDLQDAIFLATQCLTQAAGLLLELPQSTTAQACVLLARYWLVEPVMGTEFSEISAAILYLVCKMGPIPRSAKDMANVYTYLLSSQSSFFRRSLSKSPTPPPDPKQFYVTDTGYLHFHTRLLDNEPRVLAALGYDTHVTLPHALAITYLQALDFLGLPPPSTDQTVTRLPTTTKKDLSARTIANLNTALLSPQLLYLTHQPPALAASAVYAAARELGVKMPGCAWWEVFDVEREELGFLVVGMRSLEGWVRKVMEEGEKGVSGEEDGGIEEFGTKGMVTRRDVEVVLRRRGLLATSEEEEMMKALDERAETMDTGS